MLKAVMIGAGGRATRAHYPALADADDVSLEAVCDLDSERLASAADAYDIPRRYTDHRRMLDEVDCDVVYAIMQPYHVCQVAVDALDAGKHVLVEKPPGANSTEAARIAAAATRNDRLACVALQRRWTPLIRAAKQRVEARGPIRFVLAGMHKHPSHQPPESLRINVMYDRDIHMIDFVRWVCGGEWDEVLSRVDSAYTEWMNANQSVIAFTSGALAVHTAIGHAGSRYYRIELHGNGISAYLNPAGVWRGLCRRRRHARDSRRRQPHGRPARAAGRGRSGAAPRLPGLHPRGPRAAHQHPRRGTQHAAARADRTARPPRATAHGRRLTAPKASNVRREREDSMLSAAAHMDGLGKDPTDRIARITGALKTCLAALGVAVLAIACGPNGGAQPGGARRRRAGNHAGVAGKLAGPAAAGHVVGAPERVDLGLAPFLLLAPRTGLRSRLPGIRYLVGGQCVPRGRPRQADPRQDRVRDPAGQRVRAGVHPARKPHGRFPATGAGRIPCSIST